MKTPNRPESPDEFYQAMQEAKDSYTAKIEQYKDYSGLVEYYQGRLDAVIYLMRTFEIMFWEVKQLDEVNGAAV